MNYRLRNLFAHAGYMDEANAGEGGGSGGGGSAPAGDAGDTAAAEAAAAAAKAAEAAGGEGKKSGPSDEEARLLKEVMDKKNKLKASEDKAKELEAKLKQFEGIDVEGVRKMLSEKQAEETRKLEEKGQWESLKKQMAEEHQKERAALESAAAEKGTRVAALEAQIAELTVGNAFASSTFIKEDMTMPPSKARVLYSGHFEFKDGAVVAYDKASGADRAVLVDSKGDPLPFEAALKKIVESDPDRDSLLKSKVKPGAGSKTAAKASAPEQKMDGLSGKDLISAALSKGVLVKK